MSEVRDANSSFTSEAFSCATKDDIWAFCQLLSDWADCGYRRAWRAASESGDPEGDITWDVAERTGGLSEIEMAWMLRAGAVKDAVTAFEVYLEQAIEEALLRGISVGLHPSKKSAPWPVLVELHRILGIAVETGTVVDTDSVRHIREMRHLLTHRRGELSTDGLIQRFGADAALYADKDEDPVLFGGGAGRIPLSLGQIRHVLNTLHSAVDEADRAVWAIAWGDDREAAARLRQFMPSVDRPVA